MNEVKAKKLKSITVNSNCSLLEALRIMDINIVKLLIASDEDKFISVLSIGDIQRAIINKLPLETPISNVLRSDIKVCYITDNDEVIKNIMLNNRIECMPIIDDNKSIIDVIFWEELFNDKFKKHDKSLKVPVVIMAGGRGSRLSPITNIIPKPLVPIGDKPIIELIIDKFQALGVNDLFLSVNYKHEMIRYYFESLEIKNYKLNYFIEPFPLGTAGSLHLLKDKINTTFFVSNCDIIVDQDYYDIYEYHKSHNNELTIVAALRHMQIPYGTIESGEDGSLLALKEKPELTFMINTGMYILEPHLLNEVPIDTYFHITDLIEKIQMRKGRVGVFPVSEGAWMDIGEWKEYNKTVKRMGFEEIKMY